ncbi:MAG TPA: BTAD domain-containing putative transcriptional regulator [Gaiellaceae bacterium]
MAVVEDGRAIPLDRQRLRALLAYLLLHANEVISTDRLVDEVWGPTPPKTAGASLQNYVSRLRKAIGAELLLSQPPGYVLRVDPERFDLARFERLTAEARGAGPRERAEKLRAALALWRGPALEDLAFEPFARDEVGRLEEARLAALEQRIDADLELGSAGELAGELEQLVEQHPLRERFRAQLMLALYRAGRQADALEVYQDARRVLMDELGLEPSEELRALQQSILQQDPSLGPGGDTAVKPAPDRRTVTVVFCDLVDSTRLAAELDPEVYRGLMSRYFEAVRAPIERHGGTVEKFIGDAVMAVFGVPQLHEDDALRAVRAAAEIQGALRELGDLPVEARIGVTTGEVHVLSAPGSDLQVSGPAASAAAQLEGRAPEGGIMLGDETYRLVRDAVRAERVEDAWRLDEVLAGEPAYARRLDAPLVGREEELRRLQNAYTNACEDRHCRVVTVVGEAGIGKTRLARAFVASVRDEAEVLVGRCVSYGEGATYLPIAEIVQKAAAELSLDRIRDLLEGEEDADSVAQRVAELVGVAESPAAAGEAFWAVRRLLESIARKGPVVVALDDIHWAEPTLLDLVEYLGEWAEGPILVVCLARDDLLDTRSGWGGPTSTGFLVGLEPLREQTLEALVRQLADKPVDPEIQERIIEHSGGNPLFAEQLFALAEEAPELALDRTPATVEALLASRLDRLDPRELGVVRRASVVGRRFTRAELEDLSPDDNVDRHLVSLTERGLVHPVQGLFRFHHALVRDVAYRGIPKANRAELHELAAKGLDRRDGPDELVGYHFEQAYRYLIELQREDEHARELAAAGSERLGRAGIRAWKRADAPAAVNLLSRAVDLVPEAAELACELGAALRVRGDLARAEKVLVGVSEATEERLRLRARIELALMRSLVEPDRAGELLEVASGAIPKLEAEHDDRALGRAWLSVGHVKGGFYCEFAAWEEAAARAAEHYRRAGWSPSTSLGDLACALYYGPRDVTSAIARCEALLLEHDGDRASEANLLVWLGGLEAMRGRFSDARDLVDQAEQRYEQLGLSTDPYLRLRGAVEMFAGAPDRAEAALRTSCIALQQQEQSPVLATRAADLAEAIYEQDRYEEAETWLRIARESAGSDDLDAAFAWRYVRAKVLTRLGAIDEAQQLALEALDLVARTDALNRHADSLLALAEILRVQGEEDEALENIHEALRLYEQKGNVVSAERARAMLLEGAIPE